MQTLLLRPASILLALPLLAPLGATQDEPSAPPPDTAEAAQEPLPFTVPDTVEAAAGIDASQLEAALAGRERAELERMLGEWLQLVERQHAAFRAAASADEGSELRKSATRLGTDRDTLIGQAEILIGAVVDAGGDAETARASIAAIREAETRELDRISTVPTDQAMAQDLELEVLRADLRPLTKAQVEEQLAQWLALLQRKSLAVRKVEVSAYESEDPDEVTKYNERAVELRGERLRLIQRVKAVIDALERKNGDVADARAYVQSVVIKPPITGLRAAWTTARAWLLSADGGIDLGLRLARALGFILVFWLLSWVAGRITSRAMRSVRKASELLRDFVGGFARKGVFFLGLLLAAGQMGINMGPLLAIIGAAGLVIGFALQGTLSNFASGLLIMVYRPFDVGDVVQAAGTTGKVEGMTLVTTLIKTADNQSVFIPNNKVWGDVITNVTANATRRVDMTFGIGYDDDVEHAREVLMDVVKSHPQVLAEPVPNIQVGELADSSVNLIVRPWARTEDYWNVFWELTREVKKRFDEEGISIPYPQRDVHVLFPAGGGASDLVQPKAALEKQPDKEVRTGR